MCMCKPVRLAWFSGVVIAVPFCFSLQDGVCHHLTVLSSLHIALCLEVRKIVEM